MTPTEGVQRLFETRIHSVIGVSMNMPSRKYSKKCPTDRFGTPWRKVVLKDPATAHDLARLATTLTSLQYVWRLKVPLQNPKKPDSHCEIKNDRRSSGKARSAVHANANTTTTSSTHPSSSPTSQMMMALQLPKLNVSDPLGSSPIASVYNNPYCRLCLNKIHLALCCNFVTEQLGMPLIDQRSASLPGFPLRWSIQPHTLLQGTLGSSRWKSPPLFTYGTAVSDSSWWTNVIKTVAANNQQAPIRKLKTEGQRVGRFENLDGPLDGVSQWKLTKVIATNFFAAVVTGLRKTTILSDNSVKSVLRYTLITNIWDPPWNSPYTVEISYDERRHEVRSFSCRLTYCVGISVGILENTLRTMERLLDMVLVRLWLTDHFGLDCGSIRLINIIEPQ